MHSLTKNLIYAILLVLFLIPKCQTQTTTTMTTTTSTTTTSTTAQSPSSNAPFVPQSNTNYGNCNCDLTQNICDLNCCCDSFCSASDIASFVCIANATTTNYAQRWCLPQSALFLQNTPYIINSLSDLVCVDVNSSQALSYYTPPSVLTAASVSQQVDSVYSDNGYAAPLSKSLDQAETSFNASDYIWLNMGSSGDANNDSYLGFLTLPVQVGSKCRTGPPLFYLNNANSQCFVDNADITTECNSPTALTSLSLSYFYNTFTFIQNPQSPNTNLTSLSIISCQDDAGNALNTSICATIVKPEIDATNTSLCSLLVKNLIYVLRYSNPTGIIEAGVVVTFATYDLKLTNKLQQSFQVLFIPSNVALANYNLVLNSQLSGNPGYLVGRPVQASGTTYVKNGFTYMLPNSDGSCPSDDSGRGTINFGFNLASECTFNFNSIVNSNPQTSCQTLQNQLDNIILGYALDKRAQYYAPFASTNIANWAAIYNPVSTATTTTAQYGGVCKSIRTGVSIQIAFAQVGNINNPQAEIAYISFNWNQVQDIALRCTSQFCPSPSTSYNIVVSTLVTFVDVSQTPLYTQSGINRPSATLPGDFFYPLAGAASQLLSFSYLSLFFIATICLFVIQ